MARDYVVVEGPVDKYYNINLFKIHPFWYKISLDKLLLLFGNYQESKTSIWWHIKLINVQKTVTISTHRIYRIGEISEWTINNGVPQELERILGQKLIPTRDLLGQIEDDMYDIEMMETLRGL